MPALPLPGMVTAAMRGSAMRPAKASTGTTTTSKAPGAKPARRNASPKARALPVTLGEWLSTKPLPAIRMEAAARNTCQKGRFHGMIPSTVPSGRYET